jgi:hypothetical protein
MNPMEVIYERVYFIRLDTFMTDTFKSIYYKVNVMQFSVFHIIMLCDYYSYYCMFYHILALVRVIP